MCLITEQTKPIVTKRKMTVYKQCHFLSEKGQTSVKSMYQDFLYIKGILYSQEMDVIKIFDYDTTFFADNTDHDYYEDKIKSSADPFFMVAAGFHFCLTKKRYEKEYYNAGNMTAFIVPKGSLIYKDKTGLGVSNQIMLVE